MPRFTHRMGRPPSNSEGVDLASYISQGDITVDTYPMVYSGMMSGGMRSVETLADLTNLTTIPMEMREVGMLTFVQADFKTYQLDDDLVTWVEFAGGAGAGANFVRRYFQNATSVSLHDVYEYPVTEIWFIDPNSRIFMPYIYNVEDGVYNEYTYGQVDVEGVGLDHDLTNANIQIDYLEQINRVFIQFDQPRTGIAVAGF